MSTYRSYHEALRAWFLGPRAENADLLERLFTEALRDHVFWRRNHHPEDGFTIHEMDRRTEGYDRAVATLTQELMGLLAELKRGAPMFSGRYKGHMCFEQTIPAQVGYFAAMLYNPNNVASDTAPVTTRLELEVVMQLCRMIGYSGEAGWGHLTSGGTVANFEALWVARNVIYLPLALRGAADALGVDLEVAVPGGERRPLRDLSLWELVNVRPKDALDLREALWGAAPLEDVHGAVHDHSLHTLGYQEYGRRLETAFGDALAPSVVLVPATAHYSWEKIVRALGIGSNQLEFVPVNERFRMDPDALWETVRDLTGRRIPVLACVSVCGTTEESAVDRLDRLTEVRTRAEAELGVAFHLHSDACYGGYAAAVTRDADGHRRSAEEIRMSPGLEGEDGVSGWPSSEWVQSMEALADTDSISIDPHKLGYVPYPAGAVLFKDRRAREVVAVDAPYLAPTRGMASEADRFLGRFIFEGSRPGAAAAAVWLSHQVLPLDERGYGFLIERTVAGARRLYRALQGADLETFRCVLLPEPDLNIVCFLLAHPEVRSLGQLNALNEGIYTRMSLADPGDHPDYVITRTRLQSPIYDGAVDALLERTGVVSTAEWKAAGPSGLVVLRATVMDPFVEGTDGPDHVSGFVATVGREAARALEEVA